MLCLAGLDFRTLSCLAVQMVADSEHVLVLRDQDTVADLAVRLPLARRVVLIGNGGIALELAHALRGMEVRNVGAFTAL